MTVWKVGVVWLGIRGWDQLVIRAEKLCEGSVTCVRAQDEAPPILGMWIRVYAADLSRK